MRLTFRAKLMTNVAITALAFVTLIATGAFIGKRVSEQLAALQGRYVPKVELEPQLESQFERIRRGFQDAVAIRDTDALAANRDLKSRFLNQLDAARGAVDASDAAALRTALEDYDSAASDVSRRLIAGEAGEAIVEAAAAMQAKQALVSNLIGKVAALDRSQLSQAFASASRAEAVARSSQLWISLACLVSALALSLALSRGVLRAMTELTIGFERFGEGAFAQPIRVVTHDELGDVAQHANRMARSLERLSRERERAEAALVMSNRELEAFSYSVAHDLRAPLRGINGFSRALLEDSADKLDEQGKTDLRRIAAAAQRMGQLIDALLTLSRVSRAQVDREPLDLSRVAEGAVQQLRLIQPERTVTFINQERVMANGDPTLVRAIFENLLGNAWKFTAGRPDPRILFEAEQKDGTWVYTVRDNGAGFDMAYAEKLFAPFQRLHSAKEFAGTGIGLATVQRIVHRHGGRIWAEGTVGQGASFHFTLPQEVPGDPHDHEQTDSPRRG
jgi:signal transduction histidine kinase